MTRKSKRELERDLDRLASGDDMEFGESALVVFVDSETGESRTPDGEPVDVDEDEFEFTVSIGGDPER